MESGKCNRANGRTGIIFLLFFLILLSPFSITHAASPDELFTQAVGLIRQKVEPQAHLLEAWGPDLPTQAALGTDAQQAIDLLKQVHELAIARMKTIAAQLKTVDDPRVKQWQTMDRLARGAKYTLHMTDYALALSMDPGDPRRSALVNEDLAYLNSFDTATSGVQTQVRLRLARLHLLIGQYDQAKLLLASVISNNSTINPRPSDDQRRDAQNLQIVSALQQNKIAPMVPPSVVSADEVGKNNQILRYRLLLAMADAARKPDEKKELNDQATTLLSSILRERPDLWPLARRRLIERAGDRPSIHQLDPLTLRALMQRADLQRQEAKPDRGILETGLLAAKQLLERDDQPQEVRNQAAILCPALMESLGQNKEAARAFIAYAAQPNVPYRDLAFDHARWLVGQLRASAAADPQTVKITRQFLELAVVTLQKEAFAFDYAQMLESTGQFQTAADYYPQTPSNDARYDAAQTEAVRCLLKAHNPDAAARQLNALLPDKIPPKPSAMESAALQLLAPTLQALDTQYTDALTKMDLMAMRPPAELRVMLSPRLAQWTARLDDRLYDLDCRRQSIELLPNSPQRRVKLQAILNGYLALEKDSPTRSKLGVALTNYALHDWRTTATALRPLLESGALGESDPIYWEARYKLMDADWRLAGSDPTRQQAVRNGLKLLDAKWNGRPGGTIYAEWFSQLRKTIGT